MLAHRRLASLSLVALLLPLACVELPPAPDPDLDDDGVVGRSDVELVMACLDLPPTAPGCEAADANRDGVVDAGDVFALAADWERRVCNGSVALCDRRLDEVSFPTSHNAFADWDRYTLYFNHWDTMELQLSHGIRGLMLDTWRHDEDGDGVLAASETFLCHAECGWARQPLVEGLGEIRAFLEAHPAEVLVLILESYVGAQDTALAFESAGLGPYLLSHAPGTTWPTLAEMIDAGRRLVVLTDGATGGVPWLVPVWSVASETPFSVEQRSEFDCRPNRGHVGNALFILNHFLTRNSAVPTEAAQTNANPFLLDRALQCWRERSRLPSFPTVDFATTGDVVETARRLNEIWEETGGLPPQVP